MSGATSARFVYDGDGNRVKSVMGGVTTYYVGNYYEYVNSSTTKKYYYAGSQRVAMRDNNTLYFLLGDHLGSTSITANSNGTLYTEQRYYPWGDTRYNSPTTTPTTYQYTGQRKDATGLYFYNARYYDGALGRFIQADTLVPEPGNPQSLNRYAYVLNNPLRYTDPSGHYSEEEIMKSFGVGTWDEVLALFQDKNSSLHGRWGWLEVLRRAHKLDWVSGRDIRGLFDDAYEFGIRGGQIYQDANGLITVGKESRIEFASRQREYTLSSAVKGDYYFTTEFWKMHFHPHLVNSHSSPEERLGALTQDFVSIFLDAASVAGVFTCGSCAVLIQGLQITLDASGAIQGGWRIHYAQQYGGYDSDDVLGKYGWIPILGSVPDIISVISHATGYKVEWRP